MKKADVRKYSSERRTRKSRPRLEGLEDRKLLYSTTGGMWTDPQRVTFSFVPDGTNIGGKSSSLFSTLNAEDPDWQTTLQQAAASWEAAGNINLVQVSDNGVALGVGNYQQGDPNNGDIRISAIPLASGVLATTILDPPLNGGPDAGDIMFNSNINWKPSSGYSLLTVALHEFGHSIGVGESTVSTAAMYGYYNTVKSGLNTDDINGIQAIYSVRQPDAWTVTYNNTSEANAANITSQIDSSNQIALSSLDLTTSTTNNWFKVTVPSGAAATATFTMQSTNLSELSPRIQVYNSSGSSIGYATAAGTYGATVTYTLSGVSPGQSYYIKAGAANSGPTGAGGYGLEVNFGTSSQSPIAPPNTQVLNQPDQGGGSLNETVGWGRPGRTIYIPVNMTIGTFNGFADDLEIEPVKKVVVHPRGPISRVKHTPPVAKHMPKVHH